MSKKVFGNNPRLSRFFSRNEISEVIKKNKLLSLSLKLPVGCNLNCRYCYSDIERGDISYDEITDIISQAFNLGIGSLSIIGEGEPFMYKDKASDKDIFDLIKYANRKGLNVIVFTNNTLIDDETARLLFGLDVAVVCKLNSLKAETQDFLSGVKGSFKKIRKGLLSLEKAGFSKTEKSRLSLHTVICRQNYSEIPKMWVYCRRRNIIPYFQVFVPPANRNHINNDKLVVESKKVKELFYLLAAIDWERFGYRWDPDYTYPIAGLGCSVVKTGCCVDSNAKLQSCGYVGEEIADLRKFSLQEVLSWKKMKKIRSFRYHSCNGRDCHFYGCRALTFNLTDDRFAPDPFFWKK